MLMSLLKSTITKWHIFTPDFARRDAKLFVQEVLVYNFKAIDLLIKSHQDTV